MRIDIGLLEKIISEETKSAIEVKSIEIKKLDEDFDVSYTVRKSIDISIKTYTQKFREQQIDNIVD